jgi:hypothetical protein
MFLCRWRFDYQYKEGKVHGLLSQFPMHSKRHFFATTIKYVLFTCHMQQNMERVIGRCGKICEITRESMKGNNNLHSNWLGQDVRPYASNSHSISKGWCEGILLRDSINWLVARVCIDLENLRQRVERKQQSVEKD